MATYHEKKKLWEARRRGKLADGTLSRPSFWAETEEEAEELANEFIRSLQPAEPTTSFEDYATYSYAPSLKKRSENWRSQVAWATINWIFPRWGKTPIEQIKRPAIQEWFTSLEVLKKEDGSPALSAWSIKNIRKVFHAIMELAVYDEVITRNPVYKIAISAPTHEPTVWTLRQLARLVLCSQGRVWAPAHFLGGFLGVRIGESLGLDVENASPGSIRIDWQLLKERKGPKNYVIQRTSVLKTPGSHRTIPLPDGFFSRLMSMTDFAGGLVCPNRLGGFLDPENASRGMVEAISRANASITDEDKEDGLHPLPHGTSHDLRHTCKSILEDLGCPNIARRMILGHAGADAHEKYGKAFDQTMRDYLGTMLEALDREERLLAIRPQAGVQVSDEKPEIRVI